MKRGIPELLVPFLPDKPETTVDSFEEAMNTKEESYSFEEVGTYLNHIILDEQTISFDGKDYSATRWAIESLCKICGVSKPTTYDLPPPYLKDLINNIVKNEQERICVFLEKAETRVVNIVKVAYYRASDVDVLAMFQELNSKYCWNRTEIKLSERGIELSLVTDMFGEIEPVVGDITKTGFSVINSETGGRPLKASFLVFRLHCLNGAVLSDKWGEVRWTYDKRMSIETSLKTFRHKLEDMQFPIKFLEERIHNLLSNKLTDLDFKKIWRNLSRVVGAVEADSILEIKEDNRKKILRTLKEREKKNRLSLDPDAKTKPLPLDTTFYEILQLVTAKAKNYPILTKRQLEKLGGNIIG